jgi:UDP-3-O-[3-hydroxymyristoyl] glucosamine N-acyltransferase LpxD
MKGFNLLHASLHESEIRRAIGLPGEGNRVVDGLAPLGAAEDRCLYFINKKVAAPLRDSLAIRHDCIVIAPSGSALIGELGECLVLEATDPRVAITKVLGFIKAERRQRPWVTGRKISPDAVISPFAVVDQHVEISAGVVIEPFCVVESDVSIGRESILRSGVRVYSRVAIGDESVIGANTVVGHQGYGFVRDEFGNKTRIPHLGGVIIGSYVEIGALATVPSGTIMPTTIEDHAKVDDHVHVGHNVRVARGASVTAAVVIGGSAVIDAEAWIGINSSIRDGRRVGSRSLVGMDVSLQQDLAENSVARAPRPEVRTRPDDDSAAIGFKER